MLINSSTLSGLVDHSQTKLQLPHKQGKREHENPDDTKPPKWNVKTVTLDSRKRPHANVNSGREHEEDYVRHRSCDEKDIEESIKVENVMIS